MKIPRWAQVLIGVGIIAVFLGIGAIIALTAWVSQNLNVAEATSGEADAEFDKVRQQFGGRPALLEIRDGVPHYVEGSISAPPSEPPPLQALHVLVWDPREDELSRVSIPWWIIRMKSGPVSFSTYASGFDDAGVKLTTEDIEKYGPGIILDTPGRRGERVLLWAQ